MFCHASDRSGLCGECRGAAFNAASRIIQMPLDNTIGRTGGILPDRSRIRSAFCWRVIWHLSPIGTLLVNLIGNTCRMFPDRLLMCEAPFASRQGARDAIHDA